MNLYLEKGIMGFYAESKSAAGTGCMYSRKPAQGGAAHIHPFAAIKKTHLLP